MKKISVFGGALLFTIAAIEVAYQLKAEPDPEVNRHAFALVLASNCKGNPLAMRKATLNLMRYSVTAPIDLPPWRALYLSMAVKPSEDIEGNPILDALCAEFVKDNAPQ